MGYHLERFKEAQKFAYSDALREIQNGRKTSHWMWYIFPQLEFLGMSSTAHYYGISGLEEAKAYLADPLLGSHLEEISRALLELEEKDALKVFGSIDSMKLRSSMTLFAIASEQKDSVYHRVLEAYYGGIVCKKTCDHLGRNPF